MVWVKLSAAIAVKFTVMVFVCPGANRQSSLDVDVLAGNAAKLPPKPYICPTYSVAVPEFLTVKFLEMLLPTVRVPKL